MYKAKVKSGAIFYGRNSKGLSFLSNYKGLDLRSGHPCIHG